MNPTTRTRFIVAVTAIYATLALAWIFLSDRLLATLVDMQSVLAMSTAKGVLFVIVSAACIAVALRAVPERDDARRREMLELLAEALPDAPRASVSPYLFAIAVSLATLYLRQEMTVSWAHRPLLLLFMLPIMMSAVLGGLGPGLLSTAICGAGALFLAVGLHLSLRFTEVADLLQWSVLILCGVVTSLISALARRSQRRGENHARLIAEVIAGTPDAVYVKDSQGRYQLANPGLVALFGRAESQILGRHDHDLRNEANALGIALVAQADEAIDRVRTREECLRAADGRERVWLVTRGPILDADGTACGSFGVLHELTERRQAEVSLAQANRELETTIALRSREFQELYDHAPCGYCSLDASGVVERVNQTALDWLERTRDACIGRPLGEFLTPESRALFETRHAELRRTGEPFQLELDYVTRDGRATPLLLAATLVRDEAGAVAGSRHMLVDIREKKAKERQITELNRFLAEVLEATPFGVVVVDETRRVVLRNRLFGTLLDYPADLAAREPLHFADMVRWNFDRGDYPDKTYQEALDGFIDAMASKHLVRFERRQANGTCLEVRGLPLSGGLTLLTYTDITGHRQARETLEEANRVATEATRAKSAFLANMSHEIRTPMNAIIGLTHLMERDTDDVLQRERLRKVDAAAKHLLQVINDVLDLSKIEAGKVTLEDLAFDRDTLIGDVIELVREAAVAKGLALVAETDEVPARLRGDPQRLMQALINLMANAVKFTDRGWVRLGARQLASDGDRVHLRFEVRDTGIGVPLERQGAIFRAFEQADTSTTRRHGGTGLGLSLTRHLAGLMGGEAGVESRPGSGSTFWFTAWLHRVEGAAMLACAAPAPGTRVLVVDALPEASIAMADMLARMGCHVATFAGGSAALRHLQEERAAGRRFDVAFIDAGMQAADGVATMKALRGLLGASAPACALMLSVDGGDARRAADAAGAGTVLMKPGLPSTLAEALDRLLHRGPAGSTPGHAPVAGPEAELRRRHAGRHVLLAEDNPVNQEVASELLTSAGLVVDIAGDGARAVEMARRIAYDLVLMDVQMPGTDGMEATRRIREELGLRVPIIAMTANAFGEDRAACLAAGMSDHVPKPVDPDVLYAKLLQWMPPVVATLPDPGPGVE